MTSDIRRGRRLREGSSAPRRRDVFWHWWVVLDEMRGGLFSGKNGLLWVMMPCVYPVLITHWLEIDHPCHNKSGLLPFEDAKTKDYYHLLSFQ